MKTKTLLLRLLLLALLATFALPVAHATDSMCCYAKFNLPIDQSIGQYQTTNDFGFTIYANPIPPFFIYYNLTVEYHWTTVCYGGAIVLGDASTTGTPPNNIAQVNMTVQKFSMVTGQPLGLLTGVAVGPPDFIAGPPQWIPTKNEGYPCPQPR